MKSGECLHVLNFGTFSENRYFVGKYRDSFDLVSFNANLIAHAPEGVTGFVAGLKTKKFFIDPQFHAFQQHPKTVSRKKGGVRVLKESIRKLADSYGSIAKSRVGKGVVLTSELTDSVMSELCDAIARFQISTLSDSLKKLAEAEFVDPDKLSPDLLIAPYLYIEADNWKAQSNKNIEFLCAFREAPDVKRSGLPVFSQVVISKEVLMEQQVREEVAKLYSEAPADGLMLWIDDFAEFEASSRALGAYVELLTNLQPASKPIVALHGSYFSVLLASREAGKLAGVGHGIEYGEHRAVVPVGGGVPMAKYYFPKFHKRVDYYPDAQDVLLEMDCVKSQRAFLENVCDCETCKELIGDGVLKGFEVFGETKPSPVNGRPYPTARAMLKSRMHYLNCKNEEYSSCRKAGLSPSIEKLKEIKSLAASMTSHDFGHINRWIEALSELE